MRRVVSLLLLVLVLMPSVAGPRYRWNPRYQNYIDQYKDLAIQEMFQYGVPASITLAQGLLESGAGFSQLALKGNNHFGIKCHGWDGRAVYQDDDAKGECFRAYDNAQQSYEDHSRFLRNGQRYRSLFDLDRRDYRGWAYGLKAAGYATNPSYAQRLIDIIELYKLYQYDQANAYDRFMVKRAEKDRPVSPGMTLHPIRKYNENYYIKVRSGDTFKSIGKEIGISGRKIAKWNEREYHDRLQVGEIIWLKKKQKRAPKQYKNHPHHVNKGESLYSIAQFYGIRLKSIIRKNPQLMVRQYQVRVGDEIRIY